MKVSFLQTAMLTVLVGMTFTVAVDASAQQIPAGNAAQGTAAPGDSLAQVRAQLVRAYAAKDYRTLCDLLDPNASFRGSVKPDLWTTGADAIIIQRWGADKDCAGQSKPSVAVLSVPTHTLVLTPDPGAGTAQPQSVGSGQTEKYAFDFGAMDMIARPGVSQPEFHHRYLMVWRDAGTGWKLTLVDMYAQ
jgi:hypothetical protein